MQASRNHQKLSKSSLDLKMCNKFSALACTSNERSCDVNCEISDSCVNYDVTNITTRSRRPEIVIDASPERNVQLSWRKKESLIVPGNST